MSSSTEISGERLVDLAREVAARLGKDSVARSEFLRETGLTEWQVMKHFNTWNELVEAAGPKVFPNRRLSDDELFNTLRDGYLDAGGIAGGIVPRTRSERSVVSVTSSTHIASADGRTSSLSSANGSPTTTRTSPTWPISGATGSARRLGGVATTPP